MVSEGFRNPKALTAVPLGRVSRAYGEPRARYSSQATATVIPTLGT